MATVFFIISILMICFHTHSVVFMKNKTFENYVSDKFSWSIATIFAELLHAGQCWFVIEYIINLCNG